jgi:hypothetical protein
MAWIHFANHISLAFALNNAAMLTTLFDRRIYFHNKPNITIIKPTHPKCEKVFNVINKDLKTNILAACFVTYLYL